MKITNGFLTPFVIALLVSTSTYAVTPEEFAKAVGEKAEAAEGKTISIDGAAKGWKFLDKELRHLSSGDISESSTEPVEIIAQYNMELKALGVRVVLVPVPPKASVYPEKLLEGAESSSPAPLAPFLKKLEEAGVEVIDLEPVFAKLKAEDADRLLYCAQDSHWSPFACEVVADLVAEKVAGEDWLVKDSDIKPAAEETIKFYGDLLSDAEKGSWEQEELPIRKVYKDGDPVKLNPDSPVLVVGDSHTLVFNEGGDMHCLAGGVIDHLQARLGIAVDRAAQRSSGAHGPRIDLARRAFQDKAMWGKKKLLIWTFSAREFTQGTWAKGVPAQP